MLRKFFVVAAVLFMASAADAGVYGSTLLEVTGIKIQRNGADVTLASFLTFDDDTDASTDAQIGATFDFNYDVPGLNAPQSLVGTSGTGEDDFGQAVPTGTTFARSDTAGSGSLITGTDVSTIAEIQVLTPELGNATGDVSGNISVRIVPSASGLYTIAYSGTISMIAEANAPPAGIGVMVNSEFRVQLNGGGVSINDLNTDLSQQFSVTGGTPFSYTNSVTNYVTPGANLVAGQEYILTIKQQSDVELFTVPEPGTAASIILLIGTTGFVRRRKR